MPVEITWLGRNCFRLKGRSGVVLTDPCPPESGYVIGNQNANIVTISNRDNPGYSFREGLPATIGHALGSGTAGHDLDGAVLELGDLSLSLIHI